MIRIYISYLAEIQEKAKQAFSILPHSTAHPHFSFHSYQQVKAIIFVSAKPFIKDPRAKLSADTYFY